MSGNGKIEKWVFGIHASAIGDQFSLWTRCVCGRDVVEFVTRYLGLHDFKCERCGKKNGPPPQEVVDAANKAHNDRLAEDARIRAADGGSGLFWPDC